MVTSWNRAFILFMATLLAGCASTSPPEHQSQSDPNANISAWSTFGFKTAAGTGVSDEPMRMLDVNIRNAIVAELTRRGYEQNDANPQFLITYDTAAQDKVKSNPVRVGIGIGSWGGNMGGSVNVGSPSVQSYREGRLAVHAIDAAANKEVWYGTITGRVDQKNIDADAVARVVAMAMESFPPKGTGP